MNTYIVYVYYTFCHGINKPTGYVDPLKFNYEEIAWSVESYFKIFMRKK